MIQDKNTNIYPLFLPASVHPKAVSVLTNSAGQREQVCTAQQLELRVDGHVKCTSKAFTTDHPTGWMLVTSWSSLGGSMGSIFQHGFIQRKFSESASRQLCHVY